jgi:hypothetical protein
MSADQQFIYTLSCLTCFSLWSISYLLIIRRSFKDSVCGMPLLPLCANLSYEFIFGVLHPDQPPLNYANIVWFLIDLVIASQYLRYGKKEFTAYLPPNWFAPTFLVTLATAFAAILTFTYDLSDWQGNYTGWGDQLLISVSFLYLLIRRRSVIGQSLYIALTRMIGTLSLIPAQYILTPRSKFLAFIYVAALVFDSMYVGLMIRQYRHEGLSLWRRF